MYSFQKLYPVSSATYEVCWPMGRVPTGRAPHQLTESPFKYLKRPCTKSKIKTYNIKSKIKGKDLGHFGLGYIRMLGHLQLSAHLPNFERL